MTLFEQTNHVLRAVENRRQWGWFAAVRYLTRLGIDPRLYLVGIVASEIKE